MVRLSESSSFRAYALGGSLAIRRESDDVKITVNPIDANGADFANDHGHLPLLDVTTFVLIQSNPILAGRVVADREGASGDPSEILAIDLQIPRGTGIVFEQEGSHVFSGLKVAAAIEFASTVIVIVASGQ